MTAFGYDFANPNVNADDAIVEGATSANTPSTLVKRDGAGDYSVAGVQASAVATATTNEQAIEVATKYTLALINRVHMEIDLEGVSGLTALSSLLTGTSSAVGVNSLTDSGQTMTVDAYAGKVLVDSAGKEWPVASNNATVFTLTGGGTPTAGAYGVYSASLKTRGEALRTAMSAHMLGVGTALVDGEHLAADTALAATLNAIPAATTRATLITLINGLHTADVAHATSSGVHFHDDATEAADTITVNPPVTDANCMTDLNDLRQSFLNHFSAGSQDGYSAALAALLGGTPLATAKTLVRRDDSGGAAFAYVNGVYLYTGSADPTAGGGVAHTEPALYLRTGTDQVWFATGAGATAWGQLAALASPTFTGNPAAPTQSPGDNSTKLATTAYADAIKALLGGRTFYTVATGTTTLTNASATTIGTWSRAHSGVVMLFAWPIADVAANLWAYDGAAASNLALYMGRTTNANEFLAKGVNLTGANRDLQWIVVEIA
jgi:hypothetical protein